MRRGGICDSSPGVSFPFLFSSPGAEAWKHLPDWAGSTAVTGFSFQVQLELAVLPQALVTAAASVALPTHSWVFCPVQAHLSSSLHT